MPKKSLLFEFEGSEGIKLESHIWQNISKSAENLRHISYVDPSTKKTVTPSVKSIPSPFARMLLFRDAFLDSNFPEKLREDIGEDILDLMEFLFLVKNTKFAGRIGYTKIKLTDYSELNNSKHKHYIKTLNDLAVKYPDPKFPEENIQYNQIGLLWVKESSARYRVIGGTSPFTVFFTPETKIDFIDDYFQWEEDENNPGQRVRKIKPFEKRNESFLSFLHNFRKILPLSFYGFSRWLNNKFKAFPSFEPQPPQDIKTSEEFRFASLKDDDQDADRIHTIEIIPGYLNYSILSDEIQISSFYKIKPYIKQRSGIKLPLILTPKYTGQGYFNNIKFPAGWDHILEEASKDTDNRNVLPGTSQNYPWISPIHDFIEPYIIRLPLGLNSSKVYDGKKDVNDVCYLIPLKKRFFDFFPPEKIEELLKIEIDTPTQSNAIYKNDRVRISLTIPVEGSDTHIVVNKTYNADKINYESFREDRMSNELFIEGTYFSLWPTYIHKDIDWYYMLMYEHNHSVDKKWKSIKFYHYDDNQYLKEIENVDSDIQLRSIDRDFSTRIFRLKYPPEFIFLERYSGEKGFLLPKLKHLSDNKSALQWHVGIDFGTSNTVIAYTEDLKEFGDIRLLGIDNIQDLTDLYFQGDNKVQALDMFRSAINSYFIPDKYGKIRDDSEFEGKPFSTELVYLANEQNLDYPLLHSSITFKRVIPLKDESNPKFLNLVMTNLKWSNQNFRNKQLTNLFFKEIKEIIQNAAVSKGIASDDIRIYYSYPLSFHGDQIQLLKGILENNNFHIVSSYDESECAARFFRGDSRFFSTKNQYSITIDIGGGTSDIVGYNRGSVMFKNSIIYGGRDIFEDESQGSKRTNPFVLSLISSIKNSAKMNPKLKNVYSDDVYKQYSDSHSLFSYIVSKEEFKTVFNDLVNTEFYGYFRLTVLYYYSAILYFLAMNIRHYCETNNKLDEIKNLESLNIAVGGNGSRLLDWLCRNEKWEDYVVNHQYLKKFFEMVFTGTLGIHNAPGFNLKLIQSSCPKEEVVKGLLMYNFERIESNVQYDATIKMIAGEDLLNIRDGSEISSQDEFRKVTRANFSQLQFKDFSATNIVKFNELWISLFNDETIKPGLENDFKLRNIQNMSTILKSITKTELFDLTIRMIEDYYNSREEGETHKTDPYMNSFFITEVKACLQLIKSQLKTNYLSNEING